MTVAERDRIDMVIQGMSKEYQERALMNIDPDLLVKEFQRRFKSLLDAVNSIEKIKLKYDTKSWDILTVWAMKKEYEDAVAQFKK